MFKNHVPGDEYSYVETSFDCFEVLPEGLLPGKTQRLDLGESFCKVVLQMSTPTHIRQRILDMSNSKE